MAADGGEHGVTEARVPERLLVSILAIGAVAAPFLLRALDDNRLTSWRWVFAGRNPATLFALVAAAGLLAQGVARLLPARRPGTILFVCAYAIGMCFWGEPEPIVDAARYFTQAKHLEVYGAAHFLREWGREIPAWTDLPLVPFLYGIVLRVSGESRVALQAFTTLLFGGSAVLTCRIGRALWDEETGFAAGAFLLAIPYLLVQVPLVMVDVPTLFFLTLAIHASILAFQEGGAGRILLAGGAVFLALFSKYSAWLLLTVLPVVAFAHRGARTRRPVLTGVVIAAVAAVLALAVVLPRREVYARQAVLLAGYQAPGLGRWGESFLSTFLFQVHPFLGVAALLSAWVAVRRRDWRWAIAAWPVLLLVGLEVRRIRYLLPAFPMLALMAAYGLRALRARETRSVVLASAVLSSVAVAGYGYLPFLRSTSSMNLKTAGEYLDTLSGERVEVITSTAAEPELNPAVSVPMLDLFTRKRLTYRDEGVARPSGRRAEESALRFTWEVGVPRYYAPDPGEREEATALISDGAPPPARVAERLEGRVLDRTFDADEGVFRHTTRVQVYRLRSAAIPAGPGGGG